MNHGQVLAQRVQNLRAKLASQSLDAILITDEVNVRYLCGFTGDSSALLITPHDALILSDRRYEEQIAQQCSHLQAVIRGPERRMIDLIASCAADYNVQHLGLEDHAVSWQLLQIIEKRLEGRELVATSGWVGQLRSIKDASEIVTIRRAIEIAQRAYLLLVASLRSGMTEIEAAYQLERAIRDFGGEGVGFSSIIASGPTAALPHYHPHPRAIDGGQPLLIDWGAKYQGYTSDLTRTLALGSVTPEFAEVYSVVLQAQIAAIAAIRPGARLCDVDAAARNVIEEAGFGDAFGHGLGHGIGLQVHESPRMASIEEGVLQSNMIVTVEPGIYLPNRFGVRIEDDVLVTETGNEVLSSLPKGLEENRRML